MLSPMFSLIFLLSLLKVDITLSAQGGLLIPPPRSYTTSASRFGLINDHPCGNNAFATQYPSISKTYSNFVHQHVLDQRSQVVTEGSVLNVSWIPVFFSTNGSSYRFQLCMDTSSYTYSKCVTLSEYNSNRTEFYLYLDSYDINQYNSGYNYHWSSITDKMSDNEKSVRRHSLYIPNNIFNTLDIKDSNNNKNISATLVFQWIVSKYESIDNCADLVILPSDSSVESTTKVAFDDIEKTQSVINSLPSEISSGICMRNPNATAYNSLDVAGIGEPCGKNTATCGAGQCCNSNGVCGPYMSNVYKYYYKDSLLESIPIYFSLPNSGPIDPLSAQLSFCETDVIIDNRYIPDEQLLSKNGYNPNDFLDLCWMCTLKDPKDCSYTNWFDANNSDVIAQVYDFYDASTEETSSGNGGHGGSNNSNDSQVGDLVVIIIFFVIFCCIFAFLYRAYKFSKTNHRTTKMRLLDLEPDDMGKRDLSNSAIDAAGGSMHARDDITYGQHGYSDDDENDNNNININNINEKDPLDADLDNNNDKVGGILGRSSLDVSGNEKALPPGWEEYRTDAGERYYHNSEKNVTQWERPE